MSTIESKTKVARDNVKNIVGFLCMCVTFVRYSIWYIANRTSITLPLSVPTRAFIYIGKCKLNRNGRLRYQNKLFG